MVSRVMHVIRRAVVATFVVSVVMVATQDIQIFPGVVLPLIYGATREPAAVPLGVESVFTETEDGERIELWRLPVERSDRVALIFHGNGGDVANFFGG